VAPVRTLQISARTGTTMLCGIICTVAQTMDESQQAQEWRWLAGAARAGEVEEAIAAALRIPKENPDRDTALQEAATALARRRQEKDALRVAGMVEGEEMKSWTGPSLREDLALAYAAAGKIPEALRVVERMKDPSSQVTALLGRAPFSMSWAECPAQPGVALVQAKAGDKALARKTLERAAELVASMPKDAPGRAGALTALAGAQARLGEFAAARKTVEGIQRETGKAIALAALVRQLAKAGRAQEARREIDRLPVAATQVHILMHL
jgi:tetratricopeptide (TPR) repeat protein